MKNGTKSILIGVALVIGTPVIATVIILIIQATK